MPHGLYGKASPAANAWTKLTTSAVPANKIRTVNVEYCNPTEAPAIVTVAYSTALAEADIATADIKVPGKQIDANKEYARTNQLMAEGEHVWVRSSLAGLAFDVRGVEGDK
jgi:hypothetical protein